MQYVKEEKSTNFRYRIFKGFIPLNSFHSVRVTSLEGKNQILFKSTQQMVYIDGQKWQLKLVNIFHLVSIRKALLQRNTNQIFT